MQLKDSTALTGYVAVIHYSSLCDFLRMLRLHSVAMSLLFRSLATNTLPLRFKTLVKGALRCAVIGFNSQAMSESSGGGCAKPMQVY